MTKQSIIKFILLCVVILLAIWGYHTYKIHYPNREHAMTELTQTMHPYCVGRFTIDVPEQAKVDDLSQSIMGMGQIDVASNVSKPAYLQTVKQKEAELRATPHDKEGTVLHDVIRPDGVDATLLVYRDDSLNTIDFSILAYRWLQNRMFTFHYGSPDNDSVLKSKDDLLRAFALIQPRANNEIPTTPGACIESAFVPGTSYRDESVGFLMSFPKYPDLTITMTIRSLDNPDTEGMLAMGDRHMAGVYLQFPDLKLTTLRKGSRTVSGMSGEELVYILKGDKKDINNPADSMSAAWRFNGVTKSMNQPEVSAEMSYTFPVEAKTPRLTKEQLLALWDAVVNSIHPRPSAF